MDRVFAMVRETWVQSIGKDMNLIILLSTMDK